MLANRSTFQARRDDQWQRWVVRQPLSAVALSLMVVALWLLTHRYKSLEGDAELYGVQALARIHSNLYVDLFLRNTSQDTYTVFSPFYAWCIGLLGLRKAALALTVAFKIWFFLASWSLARQFSNNGIAFVTVSLLIITTGAYGAYNVFHYAEDWLTARSLGEALVISAFALYFHGFRAFGTLVASAALFVHPLIALPGVFLIICLWIPVRLGVLGAASGVLAAIGVALDATWQPSTGHFFALLDTSWLEVVRERSQFLFLQLWSPADWTRTALPFLSLLISSMVLGEPRIRKLCASAMIVGGAGLAIALVASLIPVRILLQGQAWRWVWVTVFASVLLLAPTLLAVSRDTKCGPLCAILMITAWTVTTVFAPACLMCGLVLWSVRSRIDDRMAVFLRWLAVVLGTAIAAWQIKALWPTFGLPRLDSRGEPWLITHARILFGSEPLATLIAVSFAYWVVANRSMNVLMVICASLLAVSIWMVPGAFRDKGADGTPSEIEEFSDWRRAIPPTSNVFVVPAHNAPTFAWFTLERPSYLTVDQSSGVVFSRATALEIRRRSQVLLPLMKPDWKLLSNLNKARSVSDPVSSPRALTRDDLVSLCSDPELNFIVAKENLGFDAILHKHPGSRQGWSLYNCQHVLSTTHPR